ncbi:cytochrome b/b6 domain-containing protein [Methylopila sp. M107]|uniref:cytochrome b n=1 Tax=Methylopila sp. M107 TaxID=1101190 RepID=UPI00037A0913|nr:cytochrome b/b6 domain-containing protein [Methylopila sp. M107]
MPREARFRDTPARYGRVTRALHALTAALVLWQFAIVASYKIFGETPWLNAIARFGPHVYVGLAIGALALARIAWAFGAAGRRPKPASALAAATHRTMYGLMLVVPSIAVVRVWAKGKGWTIMGVQIFEATGVVATGVVAVVDLLHGPLSWLLLCLVGGHAAIAALKQSVWRDEHAGRMIGAPARSRAG